jgi:diguanylate cyclase (GGDEF)-like protein
MPRRKASSEPPPRTNARRGQREACLIVLYGTELGKRVPLPQSAFTIGRTTKADLFLDQEAVSRHHARIDYGSGSYTVRDLRSSNGVFVNEELVVERKLEDGDRIRIGRTLLVFLSGENVESRSQDELHRLMTADPITRAYNKRYFNEALEREYARAARGQRRLSLVLFEVDGFEQIQGARGALVTDAVLRRLATAAKLSLRPQDILGRLGEGSFGVILPETDLAEARVAAEEVRVMAAGVPLISPGVSQMCAVSLGVAAMLGVADDGGAEELLAEAGERLREARAAGGNRVVGRG